MKKKHLYRDIFKLTHPTAGISCIIIAATFGSAIYRFILAMSYKQLFVSDIYARTEDMYRIVFICLSSVALGGISIFITAVCSRKLKLKIEKQLHVTMMECLKEKDFRQTENLSSGEWMTLITSDVENLSFYYIKVILNSIDGGIKFISASIFGFIVSWRVTVIIYAMSVLSIFIPKLVSRLIHFNNEQKQIWDSRLREAFLNSFSLKTVIKCYHANIKMNQSFDNIYKECSNIRINNQKIEAKMKAINEGLTYVVMAIWIFGSIYYIGKGELSIGGLMGFMQLSSSFNWPFFFLPSIVNEAVKARVSYERYLDFMTEKEKRDILRDTIDKDNLLVLKCERVEFSYNNNKIIHDVSFNLNQNEIICLSGQSGAGKTTLIKILMGLYSPDKGTITVYNNSRISYVPQRNSVFTGTVSYNICMAKEGALEEEIQHAAKLANAHNFIMDLPNGYDTVIGKGAYQISEGQMQRIAIARAFLNDGNILLMDEPTSALDPLAENAVLKSIKEISKATLLISHSKVTQSIVDRTLNFEVTEADIQSSRR